MSNHEPALRLDLGELVQEADDAIMEMCDPRKMPPSQAVEFLEAIIDRCTSAIEALKDENPELRE